MASNLSPNKKLRLTPLQSIRKPQLTPPPPPPACVAPRRRFVLKFLVVCAIFTLIGTSVFEVKEYLSLQSAASWRTWGSMVETILVTYLPTACLCIPARTRRGTLLQLCGLVCPFLVALAACTLCWGDPHDYGHGMAFAMAVLIPAFLGPLFVFLPVWLLHLILCVIEKRKEKKSY